jgi:hypothetical protein
LVIPLTFLLSPPKVVPAMVLLSNLRSWCFWKLGKHPFKVHLLQLTIALHVVACAELKWDTKSIWCLLLLRFTYLLRYSLISFLSSLQSGGDLLDPNDQHAPPPTNTKLCRMLEMPKVFLSMWRGVFFMHPIAPLYLASASQPLITHWSYFLCISAQSLTQLMKDKPCMIYIELGWNPSGTQLLNKLW